MLSFVKKDVSRNVAEKSVNSLLEFFSSSTCIEFLEEVYSLTLDCLIDSKNDRLLFRTNLKLAKLYLDLADIAKLKKVIKVLHESSKAEMETSKRGTQQLEIYALEIQMYTLIKDNKRLEEIYLQSLSVKSAIPHPKIMGIIRECGGKMYMRQGKWDKCQSDFFEAFKCYEEAGSKNRIQCLKYLVLANMMSKSNINPFESPEARPYRGDPEIIVMNDLILAYQNKDVFNFERIQSENREKIMDDPFMKDYIEDLLYNIRTFFISSLQGSTIKLSDIASSLKISGGEVEEIVSRMILDEVICGKIDQVHQVLHTSTPHPKAKFYVEMVRLASQVENIHNHFNGILIN